MKFAVCSIAVLAFAATYAHGQAKGDITVNVGSGSNVTCVTTLGETGFPANAWSITGSNSSKASITPTVLGKTTLGDLVVTRLMDHCSEQVLRTFVSGTRFPTLTLTQYSTYGPKNTPFAYMTVTLTNAFVNDYALAATTGSRVNESVSYAYTKVCFATQPVNVTGTLGTKVQVCYDLSKNAESAS